MALIIDTGPLYALLDHSDDEHLRCRRLFQQMTERRILPSPVIVELDQLLVSRGAHGSVFFRFLEDVIASGLQVENLLPEDYQRVRELCEQYADAPLGFVDASIVAVAERLNERKVVTLDHRHFRMVRPRHVDALELLP